MSERKKALERVHLRASYKKKGAIFYDGPYDLRPLYWPRWIEWKKLPWFKGYKVAHVESWSGRALLWPNWMRWLAWAYPIKFWHKEYFLFPLFRFMQRKGMAKFDLAVIPHWKWFIEGIKNRKVKNSG